MKCWKCGQEIADGTGACVYCGASQARGAATSEVGLALRTLYDRYGCQAVLAQSEILVRGLGDLVQDVKKTRNQLRLAMEAGLGTLYLEQLQLAGKPDGGFTQRVRLRLTEDAGLSDGSAAQLMGWFDEMIGWTGGPARQGTGSGAHPAGGVVIGIDLGASFTRTAVLENGKPVIVPTPEGSRALPSVVGVLGDRVLIGQEAKQQMLLRADCALPVMEEWGTKASFTLDGRTFSVQFLMALLLRKVRQNAQISLGRPVEGAAITVPANLSVDLRQAVLDAAKIAGLPVLRLVNASSAAALAYGFEHPEAQRLLLCELGGCSLDISAVTIENGVTEIVAHSGTRRLCVAVLDERIARWMADAFRGQTGLDIASDRLAMARLKDAAERARKELTELNSSHIFVPHIAAGAGGSHDLDMTLTRAKLDEMTAPLQEEVTSCIQTVCKESGPDWTGSGVVLAGGASRTPAFREAVRKAAGVGFIQRVQPDESAALGAAVQAGIVTGKTEGLLMDVNTYPFGVETFGGVTTKLIPWNTTLPAKKTMGFSTAADNQSSIVVHLLEGWGEMAADNRSLGKYEIKGIPPAKKGVPHIQVTLETTVDGLVTASAADKATGKTWRLDVAGALGMDEQSIREKARQAAEALP